MKHRMDPGRPPRVKTPGVVVTRDDPEPAKDHFSCFAKFPFKEFEPPRPDFYSMRGAIAALLRAKVPDDAIVYQQSTGLHATWQREAP